MVRKHLKEEEEREAHEKEVQAIIDKANAEVEYERIVQRALAIALAAQPASETERNLVVQEAIDAVLAEQSATETSSDDTASETSSDDSEPEGQTTIYERIVQRALAIALAAQPASETERDLIIQEAIDAALAEQSATETSSNDSESDGQTTILSGIITLTSRWTAALARGLGFRRSS
jgi:osmotically-inducible protein OsmY